MKRKALIYVIIELLLWGCMISFVIFSGAFEPRPCVIEELPLAEERNAFNGQFSQYKGKQIGTSVLELIDGMISNTNTNSNELTKLPDLLIMPDESKAFYYVKSDSSNLNKNGFVQARKMIQNRHNYFVEVRYNPQTSLIELVMVWYSKEDSYDIESYDGITLKEHAGVENVIDLPLNYN